MVSEDQTASFGARLKHAREARGVTLAEIAAATKISVGALEALERNEVRRLPGGIFGRAIVRSYATKVGLDPEATVNEFLAELTRAERERARVTRRPDVTADDRQFLERQRRALRTLRIISGLILAAILVALSWYVWGRTPAARTQERGETPPPAPATAPAATPDPANPPPSLATANGLPSTSAQLLLEFELTAASWVRITGDGQVLAEGLMTPDSRKRFAATQSFIVELGNAGAFKWWLNGKPAKSLGKAGATTKTTVTLQNVESLWQR